MKVEKLKAWHITTQNFAHIDRKKELEKKKCRGNSVDKVW
jgi:hypothetical protein